MQGISGDIRDRASDAAGDSEWMTYAQLAEARGISLRAAVRMTQRQRLRRQPGNDGKVRVLVPRDMLKPSHRASQDDGRDVLRPPGQDDAGDAQDVLRTAIDALKGENAALKGQVEMQTSAIADLRIDLDQARTEAIAARRAADRLRDERDDAEARAKAGLAETGEALQQLQAAQVAQAAAEEAAAALRRAADARRVRGRWARLRAAWGGRVTCRPDC